MINLSKEEAREFIKTAVQESAASVLQDQLGKTIESSVERGVEDAFLKLGVFVGEPEKMRADFSYLRRLRRTHERVGEVTIKTLVGMVAVALATALAKGLGFIK